MFIEDFFLHIETHHKSKRPFVAYRKPNEVEVKAMLQKDIELNTGEDFTEKGFIFSPFDSKEQTIIFPLEKCNTISSESSFSSEIEQHKIFPKESLEHKKYHIELIKKGIQKIKEGSLEKVVLSRVETVPISVENPIEIFKSLLKLHTSAFVYIWYHPKIGLWLGATPETLLHIEGQRFKTMSLAGTQAYTNSKEVIWNDKNLNEQKFVTDFIVDELEPFTERLSVAPVQTIKAGQLLHLKSKISGVLKAEFLKDVIYKLHPTPAVCGLPKDKAKEFILQNENYNREFYTGFLGELNLQSSTSRNTNSRNVENNAYSTVKTSSHLFVNLRCMQLKGQEALIYVGGGITKDSNPEEEWEETRNKMETVLNVL